MSKRFFFEKKKQKTFAILDGKEGEAEGLFEAGQLNLVLM